MKKHIIRYDEEAIGIYDKDGEVVYWNKVEWEEDSNVVFSIAHAIELACKGENLREILKIK